MKFTTRRLQKKSTIVVSKQTVEQALSEGAGLVEQLFAANQNDPRIDQLQNIMDHLSTVLHKSPQDMATDGVSTIEEYFDDAVRPEEAQMIKREVDMIAKWRRAAKPSTPNAVTPNAPQAPAKQVPMAASAKKANGAFVSDRDEKGEPKAPEKAEVPRLAAKKKEAVPEPAAAIPAPVAPVAPAAATPAPIPADGKFDIKTLSSEALAKAIKALTSIKEFETDKSAQALIEEMAQELKTRPIEQEEPKAAPAAVAPAPVAPAPVAPVPVAASSDNPGQAKIDLGGLTVAAMDEEKVASGNGGGAWVTDQDQGEVVEDGGRTPEVSEAHSMRDDNTGISQPATTAPIKLAAEMATSKAVKEAEKLGNELKRMYLDAKSITTVNDSRPVREAVEAIFRAADMFDEATKTLNKQQMQEDAEEEAAKVKTENKKKSSELGGLTFAAAE